MSNTRNSLRNHRPKPIPINPGIVEALLNAEWKSLPPATRQLNDAIEKAIKDVAFPACYGMETQPLGPNGPTVLTVGFIQKDKIPTDATWELVCGNYKPHTFGFNATKTIVDRFATVSTLDPERLTASLVTLILSTGSVANLALPDEAVKDLLLNCGGFAATVALTTDPFTFVAVYGLLSSAYDCRNSICGVMAKIKDVNQQMIEARKPKPRTPDSNEPERSHEPHGNPFGDRHDPSPQPTPDPSPPDNPPSPPSVPDPPSPPSMPDPPAPPVGLPPMG